MRKHSNRTFQEFKELAGSKFFASLTGPNTYISTSKYPKRLLHVQEPSPVTAGAIVRSPQGAKVMLFEFVSMVSGCTSYVAAHVNEQVTWTRPVYGVHPVSKIEVQVGTTDLGTLWTCVDQIEDLMIEHKYVDQFSFYTGKDVRIGDKVGGRKVMNIRETMGVKFVTAK